MQEARDRDGTKAYKVGTHRTISPEQTLERVRPHLKRMGITRVANVTGLDRVGVPVVAAIRPNSRSVAVSQGKGLTLADAKASAVMEALESWHAERSFGPMLYATHSEIVETEELVDVEGLPKPLGSRFGPNLRLLWSQGENLVNGRKLWVPYEMVHTNYTHPPPPGHSAFVASSNGLASGNHSLEAICHAICEVIERDALSLWHQSGRAFRQSSQMDPSSIGANSCREIMLRFQQAGLAFPIWEVTSDLGIPCFLCALYAPKDDGAHIGLGSGCHSDPEIALSRALTEAAQTRLTYISGARDDLDAEEFTGSGRDEKREQIAWLAPTRSGSRRFDGSSGYRLPTFREDLEQLLERLRLVGLNQVIALDLTAPEIGIPVVRVVIPGLEAPHDEPDYQPGPRALQDGN